MDSYDGGGFRLGPDDLDEMAQEVDEVRTELQKLFNRIDELGATLAADDHLSTEDRRDLENAHAMMDALDNLLGKAGERLFKIMADRIEE